MLMMIVDVRIGWVTGGLPNESSLETETMSKVLRWIRRCNALPAILAMRPVV